jgi:hypothetical protein
LAQRRPFVFAFTAVLVLLSRIPFLDAGYGTDPDAWRVACAAKSISQDGEYRASRLPGYPVQEYVYSLISSQSPLFFNLCTAILSSLAAGLFALVLHARGSKDSILAAIALACTPIVYIFSTTSMDYCWALSMLLASVYYVSVQKPVLAGILLGIAAGCRITSLIVVAPLLVLLVEGSQLRKRILPLGLFLLSASISAALVYSPVIRKYGTGFLTFYEHGYPSMVAIIKSMTIDIWGVLGTVAILVAVVLTLFRRVFQKESSSQQKPISTSLVVASAGVVSLYLVMFLRLPVEAAYLIPAIPFVLILFSLWMERTLFRVVCVLLVISSFIGGIDSGDRPWSPSPSVAATTLRVKGRQIVFDPLKGPIINDHERRISRMQFVNKLLAFSDSLRTRSVIVAGVWLPEIMVTGGCFSSEKGEQDDLYDRGNAKFVGLLDTSAVEQCRASETPIYFVGTQDVYNREIFGISLQAIGAQEIK